ncbi:DUF7878 domain-containing protein [Promicromonospora sukumoe]|uniref:DUF7878 domain-containing protein n=1 Tax=Promicromonospora sukumoe TaxID=88382 RepID=UPI0012F999E3|nr:hypothetical protein [Promicromonospora sukumoe]
MTETTDGWTSGRWLRIGAPNLTDLRNFWATGRRITAAELLLYVEADLQLRDDDRILFEEPRFEVAELAVALTQWVGEGTEPDHDFVHDPSSYEETGVIRIIRTDGGWAAGSCFITGTTAAQPWPVVRESIDTFIAVARELTARSLLEVGWSIIETMAALRRGLGVPLREAKPLVVRASGRASEFYAFQDEAWAALKAVPADDDALEFRE